MISTVRVMSSPGLHSGGHNMGDYSCPPDMTARAQACGSG